MWPRNFEHYWAFNSDRYAGRDFRLTDVHGRVIEELIA
jgi:hypothetical protein